MRTCGRRRCLAVHAIHSQEDLAAPYVPSVCQPLITTLDYQSGVKPPDLAGFAANLDFWVAEIRHRLALIDGYPARFRRFADAQARWHRDHHLGKLPARNLQDRELEELRHRLIRAASRWIAHLAHEGVVSLEVADDFREELGLPYGRPC